MAEYIEREKIGLTDFEVAMCNGDYKEAFKMLLEKIESIPAADVRPVVRAYWKSVPHKRARVCSRCEADEPYKFADDDANVYNFCPNCGAMMEES